MPSYDKKGVYKINTANSADVTLIPLGFTSKLKSLGEAGSCEVYMTLLGIRHDRGRGFPDHGG